MDLKDRRQRSLTRGRCSKDSQYNTASLEADECRVPTQKSYSSSETLKAFDHEQRLHYGGCVTDLVHHEAEEYSRQVVQLLYSVTACWICDCLSPYFSTGARIQHISKKELNELLTFSSAALPPEMEAM
ncbi:Teneurin-2 [Takifugu flavidus]|uniref:Teneurin-2 n=1 Tax=Takifugu flavidus TaxID=433684 RepID=A0A5C6MK47_9TELE|nr:Teneurin-2 [Takifugu flavidus]